MTPVVSDASAITIKLGWLITIVALLMGAASTGGVLAYQVSQLTTQVQALSAQRVADREAIISLTATLQAQGVLK